MCTLSNTNKIAYFYAACTVSAAIFSTGSKFHPFLNFMYVLARSYSSHSFLCALD